MEITGLWTVVPVVWMVSLSTAQTTVSILYVVGTYLLDTHASGTYV